MSIHLPVSIEDIRAAAGRIAPQVHRTPLLSNRSIQDRVGTEVRLKCENLQRIGAFKIRGALNALRQLTLDERKRGVVAFSSGNHAQGVALAAQILGIRATIVMPETAVRKKVDATKAYGATVVQGGVTESTRGDIAARIVEETGAVLIPPFDDERVIAGAGTVGLEIAEDFPEVENVIVPLGGGGLLAGTALALTTIKPRVRLIGVEPEAGNDGQRSFRTGSIVKIAPPSTIADGARTTSIGERNFAIIRDRVEDIVTVNDPDLLEALVWTMDRTKLVIEPTGALAIAALLTGAVRVHGPTVAVISGGNLDYAVLACNE